MRLSLTFPVLAAAAALSACMPQPVQWDEATARTDGTLADSVRLTLGEDGHAGFAAAWQPTNWPSEPGLCAATLRAVPALGGEAYASWFAARPDSSVLLRVARARTTAVSPGMRP